MSNQSHVIVVSNREPYEHRWHKGQLVCQRTAGGLTSALDPVLQRLGGTWVAWGSGEADREAVGQEHIVAVPPESPTYCLHRVWLTADEIKGGYLGYANQVLWPLCHITLDRVAYRKAWWEGYVAMNQRFANTVLDELRKHPRLVWVHDFHLALLPGLLRAARPGPAIAMFWHIPWPGPDVFRILPERCELLESMLAADSLVFQTARSVVQFVDCARQFLKVEPGTTGRTIDYKGHRTCVAAHPISVDYQAVSELAVTVPIEQAMRQARERLGVHSDVRLGLGVDRLDYTKGLLKRLWALETFFARYPDYRGRFTFVQIAVPTRTEVETYRRYREVIRQTVSEVNERYGQEGWRPIVYLEGRIGFDTLVAYYRMADLALVNSVYDGMNLVAKEYIAAQVDENGVLLVSQMAGAADELTDALVINPYDLEGMADAIAQALEMPTEERRHRVRAMRWHLQAHDVHDWVAHCLREAGILLPTPQWGGRK
jgi:alpha,alpha-trehalose-phosphate synthase [UDP-forming]